MERINYSIDKRYANITIRELLERFYVGKSNIYKMFLNKMVFVNDEVVNERHILKENDVLSIEYDEDIDVVPSNKDIEVVYEDERLLIVNKPVGMIIHSDGINETNTLVNAVANYYLKKGIHRNIRYLHRIDTETSGIVVFAKDFLTYSILSHQIETHEVKREYLALVNGRLKDNEGVINAPIGRDRHVNNKYRVGNSSNSKESITNYWLIKHYEGYDYIRLKLETGRTHQIRVHMSYLNHPLLGDSLYGGNKKLISRVALHSFRVTLKDPYTNERIIVEVDPPKDMMKLIEKGE